MSFIAGPYNWNYDGQSLGVLADAPRLRFSFTAEEVRGDNLADTIQALINRGGSMYLDLILQEWDNTKAQLLMWPFSATRGYIGTATLGEAGFAAIGCQISGKVLTATAAASSCASPSYWGFPNVVMAPNQDVSYLMGSRLRNVPISLLVLPVISTAAGHVGKLEYYTNVDPA